MKHLKLLCFSAFFAFCMATTLPLNTYAESPAVPATQEDSQIVPYSDVYEWRYTIINGKLYRRLYNATKGIWAGDWELCP